MNYIANNRYAHNPEVSQIERPRSAIETILRGRRDQPEFCTSPIESKKTVDVINKLRYYLVT